MQETIEILPVTLLDQHRTTVNELKHLARSLGLEFGWHYLLDLTWMLSRLQQIKGMQIMDAGAGTGVMQWYLAKRGGRVLSVDRESRANLPLRFRLLYRVTGLRPQDLVPANPSMSSQSFQRTTRVRRITGSLREITRAGIPRLIRGRVVIYNQDLKRLADVPDNSLDAIVAVSSLEHNPPEDLENVVSELTRVLKPGAALLATLGASLERDWFHEPSKGWCYTEASLRRLFHLSDDVPANYDRYEEFLDALRGCIDLSSNLAAFYRRSGNNGMPWGVWDPKYQPVGVCKIKHL